MTTMRFNRLWRRLSSAVVVCILLSLTGCLKTTHTLTIYPDGAGQWEVKLKILPQGLPGHSASDTDPQELQAQAAEVIESLRQTVGSGVYWVGLAANKGPESSTCTWTATGYFESLSELNLPGCQVEFSRATDCYQLTMRLEGPIGLWALFPDQTGLAKGENAAAEAYMKAAQKAMVAGFAGDITIRLPGMVKETVGFTSSSGRNVSFHTSEGDLLKLAADNKYLPQVFTAVAQIEDADYEAEWDGFRARLAAAKGETESKQEEAYPPGFARQAVRAFLHVHFRRIVGEALDDGLDGPSAAPVKELLERGLPWPVMVQLFVNEGVPHYSECFEVTDDDARRILPEFVEVTDEPQELVASRLLAALTRGFGGFHRTRENATRLKKLTSRFSEREWPAVERYLFKKLHLGDMMFGDSWEMAVSRGGTEAMWDLEIARRIFELRTAPPKDDGSEEQ
ncbi:hypothetical protein ACFL59_00030 [Planctomycetota bacterium]